LALIFSRQIQNKTIKTRLFDHSRRLDLERILTDAHKNILPLCKMASIKKILLVRRLDLETILLVRRLDLETILLVRRLDLETINRCSQKNPSTV
jgi:hypothetical protein